MRAFSTSPTSTGQRRISAVVAAGPRSLRHLNPASGHCGSQKATSLCGPQLGTGTTLASPTTSLTTTRCIGWAACRGVRSNRVAEETSFGCSATTSQSILFQRRRPRCRVRLRRQALRVRGCNGSRIESSRSSASIKAGRRRQWRRCTAELPLAVRDRRTATAA